MPGALGGVGAEGLADGLAGGIGASSLTTGPKLPGGRVAVGVAVGEGGACAMMVGAKVG
jgi:hypothetical protein